MSRWLGSIDDLSLIAQRLLRVQIENAPAIDVIRRYDSAQTLFYFSQGNRTRFVTNSSQKKGDVLK